MIPIAKLKQNMEFNKNLGELIEVMKLAATLQFNQFRGRQESRFDFSSLLETAFNFIPSPPMNHIFFEPQPNLPKAIIFISSDEGFLGELNVLLVNKLLEIKGDSDQIIVLGRQGADYLEELKIDFVTFVSGTQGQDFDQTAKLRDDVLARFLTNQVGKVHIIYARFVNITFQQIESETLFPLSISSIKRQAGSGFLIEPDFDSVITGWVKLWLSARFYQIFWSAKLAELACRIMHLEGSIQELNRINRHLKLEYFKYLHSLSDKTIREISASRLLSRH